MKGLSQFLIIVFVLTISCSKKVDNEQYMVINDLLSTYSKTVLENKIYLERGMDHSFDTSFIREELISINKLVPGISHQDREFMISQLLTKSNAQFEKSKLANRNIQLVDNFKPNSSDYYLRFSSPVFSKDYKYSFIRVYTYYWGRDTMTYYIMRKDSTKWNLTLMTDREK